MYKIFKFITPLINITAVIFAIVLNYHDFRREESGGLAFITYLFILLSISNTTYTSFSN